MAVDPIRLDSGRTWLVGDAIGTGGHGRVYIATCEGEERVIKLVERKAGTEQEIPIVEGLTGVPNVIPLVDKGATPTHWALVMPRAEMSLRDYIERTSEPVREAHALPILIDIATTLDGLAKVWTLREGTGIVHRDLKPENILLWKGAWCLTDFGIARYAEKDTDHDTRSHLTTRPYMAPEQWINKRATTQTDVYSFGVIAFELLAGKRPFKEPHLRDNHIHVDPPAITGVTPALAAIVAMCLYKIPGDRPAPEGLLRLLGNSSLMSTANDGRLALGRANLKAAVERGQEIRRRFEDSGLQSDRQEQPSRAYAFQSHHPTHVPNNPYHGIYVLSTHLREMIATHAFACQEAEVRPGSGWGLKLGPAMIFMTEPRVIPQSASKPENAELPFTVRGYCELRVVQTSSGPGRAHSLWFCDAVIEGDFGWYEFGFVKAGRRSDSPVALSPDDKEAFSALTASRPDNLGCEVAVRFTRLDVNALESVIDRWAQWFADATQGRLVRQHEANPDAWGSWRRDEWLMRRLSIARASAQAAEESKVKVSEIVIRQPRPRRSVPEVVRSYPYLNTWPRLGIALTAAAALIALLLYGIWYVLFDPARHLPGQVAIWCDGAPCTDRVVTNERSGSPTSGYRFGVHGMPTGDYTALCQSGYHDSWSFTNSNSKTWTQPNSEDGGCHSLLGNRDIFSDLGIPEPGVWTVTWQLKDNSGAIVRSAAVTVNVAQH